MSCDENAIRSAFTTSWSQGTYIEETSVNTYVINATDIGNGYFEITWQYDKATAFCNFDVEYVVMMITVDTDGATAAERIMPFVETTYGLFSHNDEYKAFGRTNNSVVGATNCDAIGSFSDTIEGVTCDVSTVLNSAIMPSCTVQCISGYTLSSGSAVYTCPANGGAATTTLVCTEIQCDALVLNLGMEGASTSNSTSNTCETGMILNAVTGTTSCTVSCSPGYSSTDNQTSSGTFECSASGGVPTTTFECIADIEPGKPADDLMVYVMLGGVLFLILIICITIGVLCRRGKKRGNLKSSSNFNSGDAFNGNFEETQSEFDENAVCTDIVDTRPSGQSSETASSRNQRAMSEVGLALETDDRRWSMASLRSVGTTDSRNKKSPAALYLQDSSVFSTPRAAIEKGVDPDDYMDL